MEALQTGLCALDQAVLRLRPAAAACLIDRAIGPLNASICTCLPDVLPRMAPEPDA